MSLKPLFSRLTLRPASLPLSASASLSRSSLRALSTAAPRQAEKPALTQTQSQSQSPPRRSTYEVASSAIAESISKSTLYQQSQAARDLARGYTPEDLGRQVNRRWSPGDVYSPHDLSGPEMAKWKKLRRKDRPRVDVLDQLALNPLKHYKNFSIMGEYITEMGRIKHSSETGLRPVNQRRMAKAVRRAMGMGLMPGVHRHPELLRMMKAI